MEQLKAPEGFSGAFDVYGLLLTTMFPRANFKASWEETLGAARPQFRSLNRRKSYGNCLFRLISPPMKFPPLAVIGGLSCARR